MDDECLKNLFSKFGPVLGMKAMTGKSGKSKGLGFGSVGRQEDAENCGCDEWQGSQWKTNLHWSRSEKKWNPRQNLNSNLSK